MIIKIWETEQGSKRGGYMYDIFDAEEIDEDTDSDDGGICTGSEENAIKMACDQAIELVKIRKEEINIEKLKKLK